MFIDIFNTDKKYNIIYADPPWSYKDKKCSGACEKHYTTMTIEDIKKLPVKNLADTDCTLFLWVTYPQLKEGLDLIDAWGFKYKTIGFQWVKLNRKSRTYFFGLERWTRGNTECCLIATKGKPSRISASVSQLIVEPIERHSKKPAVVRDKIIELMGDLPRIELFSREVVEGWDCYGNDPNIVNM